MTKSCEGNLIIHLRLKQSKFRLGKFGLGIQYKKVRFGAEFEFSLVGCQRFFRKVERRGASG